MAKKKKVRVAFKKNRQKRTRANDLTRSSSQGKPAPAEPASAERVRAKGDLSRHRTIIQDVARGRRRPGATRTTPGRRRCSSTCDTACRAGSSGSTACSRSSRPTTAASTPATSAGILKTLAIDGRNVVAVGDRVWFRPGGPAARGLIEKVEARRGTITRGYRRRKHVLAANVDQLLIVSALDEPGLKLPLVDRYLISAETAGVRPIIVLNKADLVDLAALPVGDRPLYAARLRDDPDLGRRRPRASTASAPWSPSGTTAFSGQSGVGKSSLLNAIQPGLNLRVREVSDWTFKGKHTTTTAELIRLDSGGYVVDTPGLRQFELWGVDPGELEGHFVEFRPYIPLCKFPDCSHTHEADCAVKDAVHWGQIHSGRFESYLKLYHQQPLDAE